MQWLKQHSGIYYSFDICKMSFDALHVCSEWVLPYQITGLWSLMTSQRHMRIDNTSIMAKKNAYSLELHLDLHANIVQPLLVPQAAMLNFHKAIQNLFSIDRCRALPCWKSTAETGHEYNIVLYHTRFRRQITFKNPTGRCSTLIGWANQSPARKS